MFSKIKTNHMIFFGIFITIKCFIRTACAQFKQYLFRNHYYIMIIYRVGEKL